MAELMNPPIQGRWLTSTSLAASSFAAISRRMGSCFLRARGFGFESVRVRSSDFVDTPCERESVPVGAPITRVESRRWPTRGPTPEWSPELVGARDVRPFARRGLMKGRLFLVPVESQGQPEAAVDGDIFPASAGPLGNLA